MFQFCRQSPDINEILFEKTVKTGDKKRIYYPEAIPEAFQLKIHGEAGRKGDEGEKLITQLILSSVARLGSRLPHNDSVYFGASLMRMRTVAGDKKYINGSVYFHAFGEDDRGWWRKTSECQLSAMFMSVISERFHE